MGGHTVVRGLLACAAISVTGCWMERDAQGKLRIYGYGEYCARRSYLEETEPERSAKMMQMREAGFCLTVLGAAGLGYVMVDTIYRRYEINPEEAGLLVLGGLITVVAGGVMEHRYVDYVRKEGRRRRGQLLIGPNGCALAYRF